MVQSKFYVKLVFLSIDLLFNNCTDFISDTTIKVCLTFFGFIVLEGLTLWK